MFTSRLFHLYDEKASGLVKTFHDAWEGCYSFYPHFSPNSGHTAFSFRNAGDMPLDDRQQEDWDKMQELGRKMRGALDGLLVHVRENYVDVDLEQTSRDAWREFIEFQQDFKPRVEG